MKSNNSYNTIRGHDLKTGTSSSQCIFLTLPKQHNLVSCTTNLDFYFVLHINEQEGQFSSPGSHTTKLHDDLKVVT